MLKFEIRSGTAHDAEELTLLYHEAVHGIGSLYYSEEQARAWSPEPPDPDGFRARMIDGRTFLVAVAEDGRLLAYGDVERDGHIDHLYARPQAAGTEVVRRLYERLETSAKERHLRRMYVEASEPASRFFLKRGWRIIERTDFEILGVPIHNYRMEKLLA